MAWLGWAVSSEQCWAEQCWEVLSSEHGNKKMTLQHQRAGGSQPNLFSTHSILKGRVFVQKKMPGCLNCQQFRWSARPFTKISLLCWRLLWITQSVAEFEEKYSGNVTPLLLSSRTRSWRDLYLPKSYIFKKRDQEFWIYKYRAQDFCIYKYRALQHDSDTTGRVLLQIWSSIKDGPGNA